MEIGVGEIDLEDTFSKCNEDEYSANNNEKIWKLWKPRDY